MHSQARSFVEQVRLERPDFFYGKRVLEVGSLDINGGIKDLFSACQYTGIDLGPGPGVDVVSSGADYNDEPFDVVCSSEMFEHCDNWRGTWTNMVRLCRPGGLVFFTCATTGRREHCTRRTNPEYILFTPDYYENRVAEDFDTQAFESHRFEVDRGHHDLYFWGIKWPLSG
jgi:SAM-dependent methyltransferase